MTTTAATAHVAKTYARPEQVRELANAIALQAQAIADGTVGPRQMPVQLRKLADNVATLKAWTPTIDALDVAHDAALDENLREHRQTRYYSADNIALLSSSTFGHVSHVLAAATGVRRDRVAARYPQALVKYVMPIIKAQRRGNLA